MLAHSFHLHGYECIPRLDFVIFLDELVEYMVNLY